MMLEIMSIKVNYFNISFLKHHYIIKFLFEKQGKDGYLT